MKKRVNYNSQIRSQVAKSLGLKRLPTNIHLDHIIPKWAGGSDHPLNLQLLSKKRHKIKTAYENAIKARLKKRKL